MLAIEWIAENIEWVRSTCRRVAGTYKTRALDLYDECVDLALRIDDNQTYDEAKGTLENYMRRSIRLHILKMSTRLRDRLKKEANVMSVGGTVEIAYSIFAATETTEYNAGAQFEDSPRNARGKRRDKSAPSIQHYDCQQEKSDAVEVSLLAMERIDITERVLLIQYFWEGLTFKQLGESYGQSDTWAYKKLQGVIAKLRDAVNLR
jgi:RNA polymerase sigma factor (sigma-70 family)